MTAQSGIALFTMILLSCGSADAKHPKPRFAPHALDVCGRLRISVDGSPGPDSK
jgi:hypothetical protein